MIETTPEGFKILIRTDGSKEFMIDSDRLEACVEYIKRTNIRLIGINSFLGYKKNEINFLTELADYVEGVIIPEAFSDISVLNSLRKLKTLGFADNKTSIIDLSNFPFLATLACDYSPRLKGLEACEELSSLTLSGYKSDDHTVEEIPPLSSLVTLSLFVTNVRSLVGIGRFPLLKELKVFRAKRLEDISELRKVSRTLTTIEFDSCKGIRDYEILSELSKLKKLIISNSGEIASLDFVRDLHNLEFVSFVGTNIKNGDLSPCIEVKYVGFDDKRHYNMRFEDFRNR
jgi:Leucine-rich repeat (LRR) protein